MRFLWTLFVLALLGLAVWLLNLDDPIRTSLASGHLLDWVMGALCLLWLGIILKVPWDLFFQAQAVLFELDRSAERGIPTIAGREGYVRRVRSRLAWAAVGAHLASALLIAGITFFTGGAVGYYFAVFYLISTAFRPAVAGYEYLSRKLLAIAEEAHYPREDVVAMRDQLTLHEGRIKELDLQAEALRRVLDQESAARAEETQELRQNLHALGRELETTVSRLTDNQELIRGIQAFVRLVAQSTNP